MALTPFTGVVSSSTLQGNFDDARPTINTNAVLGQVDFDLPCVRASLDTTDDVSLRSVIFMPSDDWELRVLRVSAKDGTAARTVTATLSVADGDTDYLLGQTVTATVTTIIGTAHGNTDYRTTTGTRLRLLKGVRYKLTLSTSAGPVTLAQATLVLRTRRRRA